MANSKSKLVYPARYFAGFIEVQKGQTHKRVVFDNAPIIPVSAKRARIFCGDSASPFYDDFRAELGRLDGAHVTAIQYAISVLDLRIDDWRVEKFNHTFETPTVLRYDSDSLILQTADGSDLYGVYSLHEVLDDMPVNLVQVTQFIA